MKMGEKTFIETLDNYLKDEVAKNILSSYNLKKANAQI